MKIKIGQPQWFSEIGRKDNQEDYLWPNPSKATTNNRIFIMCDGVGGQDSGEVASETAATALGVYLTSHKPKDGYFTESLFNEALNYAYDELDKKDTGAQKKMGTTMTCLVLHRGGALVAHIGDSRIYHIRPSLADVENGRSGIIYQSADHSLVNDLLRAGELTEEEAKTFPQKNVITRAMQPHLERRCKADIYNIDDIQAGDYFFLCCDGVLEQLTNEKLGAILSEDTLDDEEKIVAIKSICDGNTKDNYTCWMVPVLEVESEVTDIKENDEIAVSVEPSLPVANHTNDLSDTNVTKPSYNKLSYDENIKGKNKSVYIFVLILLIALALGAFFGKSFFINSDGNKIDTIKVVVDEQSKEDSVKPAIDPKVEVSKPVKEDVGSKKVSDVKSKLDDQKQQETKKPEEINSVEETPANDSKVKNSLLINNQPKEQPDGKQQ